MPPEPPSLLAGCGSSSVLSSEIRLLGPSPLLPVPPVVLGRAHAFQGSLGRLFNSARRFPFDAVCALTYV